MLLLPSFVHERRQLFGGAQRAGAGQAVVADDGGHRCGHARGCVVIAGGGGRMAVAGLGAALTSSMPAAGLMAWRFSVPARHERWLSPASRRGHRRDTGGPGVSSCRRCLIFRG